MYIYDSPIKKEVKNQNFLVPPDWVNQVKRPRGIEYKNGVYYILDATPSKNVILVTSADVLHLKELSFFLIWRYQKTYTREAFERSYGQMFKCFQDFLDKKRTTLEGISGIFNGIVFGDRQYKFKQTFYVHNAVPPQMRGANLVIGLSVLKIIGPAGNEIRNPKDFENAYKELKTIFGQEIDYMAQNPAFQQSKLDSIVIPKF